jgi:hypothetical protein
MKVSCVKSIDFPLFREFSDCGVGILFFILIHLIILIIKYVRKILMKTYFSQAFYELKCCLCVKDKHC